VLSPGGQCSAELELQTVEGRLPEPDDATLVIRVDLRARPLGEQQHVLAVADWRGHAA